MIFEHELALALGMSVAEIRHGRGAPMPISELAVAWPLFYRHQAEQAKREAGED